MIKLSNKYTNFAIFIKNILAYRPNPTSSLPTLLETVLVPVRDPRLVKDLPNDSVYQIVRKFFSSSLASALNCDRTRDPRLKERLILVNNKSDSSSGEEDWYHEKIEGKPRKLKIRIHLKRLKWLKQTSHSEPSSQIVYNIAEPGQSPERVEVADKAELTANSEQDKPLKKSDKKIAIPSEKENDSKVGIENLPEPKVTDTAIKQVDETEKSSVPTESDKHKKHKKQKKPKKVKHKKKRSPSPGKGSKDKNAENKLVVSSESLKSSVNQDKSDEVPGKKIVLPVPKPEEDLPFTPAEINQTDDLTSLTSIPGKNKQAKDSIEGKPEKVSSKLLNVKELKAASELVKKRIQGNEVKDLQTSVGTLPHSSTDNQPVSKTPTASVKTQHSQETVALVAYPRMYQDPRLREKMKTIEPVPTVTAETLVAPLASGKQDKRGILTDPRLASRQRSSEKKQAETDVVNKQTETEIVTEPAFDMFEEKESLMKEPVKFETQEKFEEQLERSKESAGKKSSKSRRSSRESKKKTLPLETRNGHVEEEELVVNSTPVKEPKETPNKLLEIKSPFSSASSQTSGIFHPLSNFVKKMCDKVDTKINERIDILVKSQQDKTSDSLEKVSKGKHCDALEFTPKFRHFPPLSLSTQLESSLMPCPSVQKILSEEMMLWMKEKPLDMCLLGKQTEHFKVRNNNNIIKASPRTDETVKQALNDFNAEVFEIMKEQDSSDQGFKRSNNGLPKPQCKTDETVHQVYRQVTQYLDFLASKELSTTSQGPVVEPNLFDDSTKGAEKSTIKGEIVSPRKREDKAKVDKKDEKKDKSKKEKHKKKDKEPKKKEDKEKKKDIKEKLKELASSSVVKPKKEEGSESSSKKGRWDSNSKLSSDRKSTTDDGAKSKVLHVTSTVKKTDKPKVAISLYDPHDPTDEEYSSGKPGSPIPYQLKTVPDVVKSGSTTKSTPAAEVKKYKDHKSRRSSKTLPSESKVKIDVIKAKQNIKDACETIVLDPLAENLGLNFDPLFDVRNLKDVETEDKNPWDISHYYRRKFKEYVQYINTNKFPDKKEMSVVESEGNFAFAYMKSIAQGKKARLTKPVSTEIDVKSVTVDTEVNEYGTDVNEYGSTVSKSSNTVSVPGLQPGLATGENKPLPHTTDQTDSTNKEPISSDNGEKRSSSPKPSRGFEPVAVSAKDKVSIAPKIKLVVSSASKVKTTSTTSTSSTVKSNTKPKIAKSGNWLVRSFQQAVQAKQKMEDSAVASKTEKGRLSALQKMKLSQQSKKDLQTTKLSEQQVDSGEPEAKKRLISDDGQSTETSLKGDSDSAMEPSLSSETSGKTLFRHSFKKEESKDVSPAKKPRLVSAEYVPPLPSDIPQAPESPQEDIDLSEVLEMTIERSPVRIETITQEVPEQPPLPDPEPDGRNTPVMDDIPLPPAGHVSTLPDPKTAVLQAQAITYSQDAQQYFSQQATTQGAAVTYTNQEQHAAKPRQQNPNQNFNFQPDVPQPDESYSHIAQQAQEWSQWQAAQQAGHHQPNWQWDHVSQQWVDYNAYYSQWNTSHNYNYMPQYNTGSHYPQNQWQQPPPQVPPQAGWEGWNQPAPQPAVQDHSVTSANISIPPVADMAPGTEPSAGTTEEEQYDENAEEGYTTGQNQEAAPQEEKEKEHEETYSQYYYQQQQQSQPAFIPTDTDQDNTQKNNNTPQQSGDVWRQLSPGSGNGPGQHNNFRDSGPPAPGVGLLPHPQQFRGPNQTGRFQAPFEPRMKPPFDQRFGSPSRFQGNWGVFRKVELQPGEDPNQSPARHVRMYVFNKDQSICKSILVGLMLTSPYVEIC